MKAPHDIADLFGERLSSFAPEAGLDEAAKNMLWGKISAQIPPAAPAAGSAGASAAAGGKGVLGKLGASALSKLISNISLSFMAGALVSGVSVYVATKPEPADLPLSAQEAGVPEPSTMSFEQTIQAAKPLSTSDSHINKKAVPVGLPAAPSKLPEVARPKGITAGNVSIQNQSEPKQSPEIKSKAQTQKENKTASANTATETSHVATNNTTGSKSDVSVQPASAPSQQEAKEKAEIAALPATASASPAPTKVVKPVYIKKQIVVEDTVVQYVKKKNSGKK